MALNVRTTGDPERVWGQIVSGNFFDVLGVKPIAGRAFLPDEDRTPNAAPVVVISDAYWRTHLNGDPSIVGRTVTLNGRAFTIVGVAPPSFRGNAAGLVFDVWVPMMMQTAVIPGNRLEARGDGWLQVMAKLKPGVPLARAQHDVDVVAARLAADYPVNAGRGARLYPLWKAPGTASVAMLPVLSILMGVVGVVLLIACANVTNLLLARAAGRQRETAVRLALGASRGRLVQQLFTETMLLAVAGGAVGAVMAYWTSDLLRLFFPPTRLPLAVDASLSAPVLLFATLVTVASALAFGLVPALQGSRSSLVPALKESSGAVSASPRRMRLRQALVVAQVALSLVLLVSAGLFLKTLRNAQAVDPGFSLRSGLITSLDLLPAGYDASRGAALFRDLLARVRALPGVGGATLTSSFPLGLGNSSDFSVAVDGYTPAPNEELTVYYDRVGSDYLRTMGIRILAGRDVTDRDTSETLRRRRHQRDDGEAILERPRSDRRRIHQGRPALDRDRRRGGRRQVQHADRAGARPSVSAGAAVVPARHRARGEDGGRTAGRAPRRAGGVRQVDPNLPIFDTDTIDEHLEASLFLQRMAASLLGGFGVLALLLATIGLYGVIAAGVAQRAPEIGMRMALGASRRDIVSMVLRSGAGGDRRRASSSGWPGRWPRHVSSRASSSA